jgi:CysZ protein
MINNAFAAFSPSVNMIFKNKVNLILAVIPVIIGILLYWFAGSAIYEAVMGQGQELINEYIKEGTWGAIVYYLVAAIFSIMLFFIVNWTFVLVVALLASPFNDLLSERIENIMKGDATLNLTDSMGRVGKNIFKVIFVEIKKILLIMGLTLISVIFGYIPFLTPISIMIAILLLAVEFLDYSWSRHEMTFGECLSDIKKNLMGYLLGGGFFFILVSIPVVNLIVPSLATSYFTTLWLKNR